MKKQEEMEPIIDEAQDLLQMYQAGYLDCWRGLKRGRIAFKEFNLECMKSFEKRFVKKIQKKINKELKHGGNIRQKVKKSY